MKPILFYIICLRSLKWSRSIVRSNDLLSYFDHPPRHCVLLILYLLTTLHSSLFQLCGRQRSGADKEVHWSVWPTRSSRVPVAGLQWPIGSIQPDLEHWIDTTVAGNKTFIPKINGTSLTHIYPLTEPDAITTAIPITHIHNITLLCLSIAEQSLTKHNYNIQQTENHNPMH